LRGILALSYITPHNGKHSLYLDQAWRGHCPLHAQGQPSIFGIDNVDLTLSGKSTSTSASGSGTAKQAPGLRFEVTLIRIKD
jgi:hypothetical protein